MRGRRWPRSPCPRTPGGTGRTNATRNDLGTLSPALREEDDGIARDPSSPILAGFLLLTPSTAPFRHEAPRSGPRKRCRLYLFWYIAVGSFNLCNRLREDFIQRGESNYYFICNRLPSQGLHLSELEGPVSPCTHLDFFFCETGSCLRQTHLQTLKVFSPCSEPSFSSQLLLLLSDSIHPA